MASRRSRSAASGDRSWCDVSAMKRRWLVISSPSWSAMRLNDTPNERISGGPAGSVRASRSPVSRACTAPSRSLRGRTTDPDRTNPTTVTTTRAPAANASSAATRRWMRCSATEAGRETCTAPMTWPSSSVTGTAATSTGRPSSRRLTIVVRPVSASRRAVLLSLVESGSAPLLRGGLVGHRLAVAVDDGDLGARLDGVARGQVVEVRTPVGAVGVQRGAGQRREDRRVLAGAGPDGVALVVGREEAERHLERDQQERGEDEVGEDQATAHGQAVGPSRSPTLRIVSIHSGCPSLRRSDATCTSSVLVCP